MQKISHFVWSIWYSPLVDTWTEPSFFLGGSVLMPSMIWQTMSLGACFGEMDNLRADSKDHWVASDKDPGNFRTKKNRSGRGEIYDERRPSVKFITTTNVVSSLCFTEPIHATGHPHPLLAVERQSFLEATSWFKTSWPSGF